jgi:hypothetical protein
VPGYSPATYCRECGSTDGQCELRGHLTETEQAEPPQPAEVKEPAKAGEGDTWEPVPERSWYQKAQHYRDCQGRLHPVGTCMGCQTERCFLQDSPYCCPLCRERHAEGTAPSPPKPGGDYLRHCALHLLEAKGELDPRLRVASALGAIQDILDYLKAADELERSGK